MATESDRKTDIGKAELAAALRQAILDGSCDRVEKLNEYEGAVSVRFNYTLKPMDTNMKASPR